MISIIVPTYHEAGNIPLLLRRIRSSLTTNGLEYEVIIVDDDSRDGTDAVVSELRSESHPVRLITRHGDRGLSSALQLAVVTFMEAPLTLNGVSFGGLTARLRRCLHVHSHA